MGENKDVSIIINVLIWSVVTLLYLMIEINTSHDFGSFISSFVAGIVLFFSGVIMQGIFIYFDYFRLGAMASILLLGSIILGLISAVSVAISGWSWSGYWGTAKVLILLCFIGSALVYYLAKNESSSSGH